MLAVSSYTSYVEKSKLKSFETYENSMYSVAMELMVDSISNVNSEYSFPNNHETMRITLLNMVEKKK